MSFPDLHDTGADIAPAAAEHTPRTPGLDSAVEDNWIQEFMDQNLDQDHSQNKEQVPLQKLAVNEESKTLVIPQI